MHISGLMRGRTVRGFASTLRTTQAGPRSENAVLRAHPEARFERFALTPVQHAYLVGRDETLVLGGIGANFYLELMVTVSIMSAGRTRGAPGRAPRHAASHGPGRTPASGRTDDRD